MRQPLKPGPSILTLAFPLAAASIAAGIPPGKEHVTKTVENSKVSLSVTVAKQPVAGEAIELVLLLRNQRAEAISYWHITDFRDFYPILRDQQEKPIPKTRFGELNVHGEGDPTELRSRVTLGPGEERRLCLNLARLFDCTLAGEYLLSAKVRVVLGLRGDAPEVLLQLRDVKLQVLEPGAQNP